MPTKSTAEDGKHLPPHEAERTPPMKAIDSAATSVTPISKSICDGVGQDVSPESSTASQERHFVT